MQISLATNGDITDLVKLLALLFTQEQEFTADTRAQTAALTHIINNPAVGHIIVARADGQAVAMVNLLYTVSTATGGKVCLLEDMIVASQFRNQAIGTQLLNYAIAHAKQAGCGRITLLTDVTNIHAQRFYKQFGFTHSAMLPMRLFLDGCAQTNAE
ncbi:MAG TPA: GNAT family N-acetyltransferase [Cellvibrionaceae bacterium]